MPAAVFLFSLLGAMTLGMPIAFALLVSAIALMLHLDMFDAQIIAQNVINGADSFALMAVPFFLLAGEIMNVGGLSRRIVNVAMALVGHVRGGLGYVTVVAACVLAALSGSAIADAAALATLLVPMMVQAGHDRSRAAGLVASAGIIGPIIPPSIGFVIFGVAANLSISKLFLAGIMPGIYLGVALMITWWFLVRKEHVVAPPRCPPGELRRALLDGSWALMLPFIVIFGLKFGIFTPTEAGVVAAVYSFFVAVFVYRELKPSQIYQLFVTSAKITSVVMFLVAAALVAGWLITIADMPAKVIAMLEPLIAHPTLLLIAMMVLVILVGTAMDMTPTILILTPVLIPVVKAAGIDPIYFGVLFMINNAIGLITPPVGTVLNVVAGVAKISIGQVARGVMPFMLAQLIVLFLLVLFPSLVTVPAKWFTG
ncbi:TRAP transporter large permease subunit [Piscinibacter sakaiensis]|uniref:TRAP transporter large permease subunit n=1 Tax=Piscinibacter sakaiensis TaxID=1547922 RepID=UPI003AAF7130